MVRFPESLKAIEPLWWVSTPPSTWKSGSGFWLFGSRLSLAMYTEPLLVALSPAPLFTALTTTLLDRTTRFSWGAPDLKSIFLLTVACLKFKAPTLSADASPKVRFSASILSWFLAVLVVVRALLTVMFWPLIVSLPLPASTMSTSRCSLSEVSYLYLLRSTELLPVADFSSRVPPDKTTVPPLAVVLETSATCTKSSKSVSVRIAVPCTSKLPVPVIALALERSTVVSPL